MQTADEFPVAVMNFSIDTEILCWCLAGPVLPHGEKLPLLTWLAPLLVMVCNKNALWLYVLH